MLRSCYAADFNLPVYGTVRGYYYFAEPDTPFFPGWTYLGSANWHRGDGSPWPTYGETENTTRPWRNGAFVGDTPPPPKHLGSPNCLESTSGDLIPVTWRWGVNRECYPEVDEAMPAGGIIMYGGAGAVPAGWLECDGSEVSRTYYGELFAAIGVTWGAGDGVNTFNLPDMRSRMPVCTGQGPGLTSRALASSGGLEDVTLTMAEIPPHFHNIGTIGSSLPGPPGSLFVPAGVPPFLGATDIQGGGASHTNMPPYRGVRFIIRTHN